MKRTLVISLLILVGILASACQVVPSGNYTLRGGETVRGDLWVASGNAILEEDSRVTGNVYVASGNLEANGEIDGAAFVFSGNTELGPESIVRGDIIAISGNVRRSEGSRVEGQPGYIIRFAIGVLLAGLVCISPFVLLLLLVIILATRASRRRVAAGTRTPGG
jgi:hypothetical protein